MLITNINKFNQQKEQEREASENTGYVKDDRFQTWKAGNTYGFRLLATEVPEGSFRKGMVLSYHIHQGTDSAGKSRFCICPTSFDPKAYTECPVCQHTYKITKIDKTQAKNKDVNKYFKKWKGVVPVVVTYDTVTPENVGHVKLIRLTQGMYSYLIKKGVVDDPKFTAYESKDAKVDPKRAELESRMKIGFKAISLDDGRDLMITVSMTKTGDKDFLHFEQEFADTSTPITVPIEQLQDELEKIEFDKCLTPSTKEQLQSFYNDCILGGVSPKTVAVPPPFVVKNEVTQANVPTNPVVDESDDIPGLSVGKPVTVAEKAATVPLSVESVSLSEIDEILNS